MMLTMKHSLARNTGLALTVALAAGCATPPAENDAEGLAEYNQINDPAEPTNRAVFSFNRGADDYAIKPAAQGYRHIPEPVRTSIHNFLTNLGEPLTFFHDVLQGEFARAGHTAARFATNTTIGFFGVGDVADDGLDIRHHDEDMGQTLAVWGVGEGPYVMLPLFGPSNTRDSVGKAVDFFLDPTSIFGPGMPIAASMSKTAVAGVDKRERHIEALDQVERSSIDYYASLRTLYRQKRADDINNGRGAASLPDSGLSYRLDLRPPAAATPDANVIAQQP